MRHALRRDEGVAMLFVISIGFVVTLLAIAMFGQVLQNQADSRKQRNITSAQAAAEAGLDDAVFALSQYNANGQTNWAYLPTQWTAANKNTVNFGPASYSVWLTNSSGGMTVWSQGKYGAHTRTIRATVSQGSPPAFEFSMFASKGIDIHNHGNWLSPQVWTTSVHSNGYINIDYPSEFTVDKMSAVGPILFQKGGGKNPAGSVGTSGYSWYDPLNGLCYPGGKDSPGGIAPTSGTTCPSNYSGNAMVAGTINAGSVTVGSRGQVLPVASPGITLDTGQVIPAAPGNITAGSASINGSSYSNPNAACGSCNKGSSAGAGQVSGSLTVQPGYAPDVIPFPSIDLGTVYGGKAQTEGHRFASSAAFLTYATSTTANFRNIDPTTGVLTQWQTGDPMPGAILLDGTFDIQSGSLALNYGTIQSKVQAATGLTGAAPMIIVKGALVVEAGDIDLSTGLVVVGSDNPTNFLVKGTATTPVKVNTQALVQNAAVYPGVLAAGGKIDSSDYDTDSPWTSVSSYEPAKASPIYVRGLVYSALWNPTTKTSTPMNQHWHNFDPKNLMKIYGAQVGAQLHDCNNFNFSYDPIVRNAYGFTGGSVKVIDYQELGT
jgi:hypothetical protein